MKFPFKWKKKRVDEKNFCAAPFVQMLLEPRGKAAPCCWQQAYVYGNIENKSFEDLWNGPKAKALREEFLSGKVKTCAQEIRHIGCNKHYHRFNHLIELDAHQEAKPKRFDLRLNGRCNLSCVMCDVWTKPNGLYDDSFFWNEGPEKFFPFLKEIDMLGGEPFIQKDTYRLIDEVSALNEDCTWAFVTNAHYQFNKKLKTSLDKINLRWLQVSIDSLEPETYAKIRIKGKLSQVLETIDNYVEYLAKRRKEISFLRNKNFAANFELSFSICVQKLNWHEIVHIYRFCKEKGATPVFQFAYKPHEVSLLNLPQEEMKKIYDFFKASEAEIGKDLLSPIVAPLEDALNNVTQPAVMQM